MPDQVDLPETDHVLTVFAWADWVAKNLPAESAHFNE